MLANFCFAILLAQLLSLTAQASAFQPSQSTLEERFALLETDYMRTKADVHSLTVQVQTLSVENKELKSAKATLEKRVDYLEAITRNDVPRTCQDLKNLGVAKSGTYFVDPDGPGLGDAPISVFCDMASGTTRVLHHLEGTTVEVEHCIDPGCHSTVVNYDATDRQLKALVGLSQECSQDFKYDCFRAPLMENGNTSMALWVGADGQPNYYWDGSQDPSTHMCACGQDGSCINEIDQCNCDSGLPQWISDAGTFTQMSSLPVKELRFGGLLVDGQHANFKIGALVCGGRKTFAPTESCESLRLAGHTSSGYYLVDGPDGLGFDLVLCNMEQETDDPGLEAATEMKFPEYQVAFDAMGPISHGANQVATFEVMVTNQGNAFDPQTGTFTAPFPGVYSFSFFHLQLPSDDSLSRAFLRVNGAEKGGILDRSYINDDRSSSGMVVVFELSANDAVDVYMTDEGFEGADIFTHFTGTLMYPL